MPINRLLKDTRLPPEEIAKLNAAYADALRSLSLIDRNDPLTEIVAQKVIEIGTTESDPIKISARVLKHFKSQEL